MKKILCLMVCVLMVVSFVAGSGTSEEKVNERTSETEDVVLGLSLPNLDATYFEAERDEAERLAEKNGFKLLTAVGDGDINKQQSQIEDFITKGVDAVICVAVDTTAIVTAIDMCAEADIPFIALGRIPADLTNVAYYVEGSNYQQVEIAVEEIYNRATAMGKTKIKVIEMIGSLEDANAVEKTQAFGELCEEKGIEIVGQVSTEWNAEVAYNRLNDLLSTVTDFDAIYMPSDMLISGTVSVLELNGMFAKVGEEGHIILTGNDGDSYAVSQVLEGNIDGTVNCDAFALTQAAVDAALIFAQGDVPAEKSTAVDSMMVSTDNVQELVNSNAIWGAM